MFRITWLFSLKSRTLSWRWGDWGKYLHIRVTQSTFDILIPSESVLSLGIQLVENGSRGWTCDHINEHLFLFSNHIYEQTVTDVINSSGPSGNTRRGFWGRISSGQLGFCFLRGNEMEVASGFIFRRSDSGWMGAGYWLFWCCIMSVHDILLWGYCSIISWPLHGIIPCCWWYTDVELVLHLTLYHGEKYL